MESVAEWFCKKNDIFLNQNSLNKNVFPDIFI